MKVIKRAGRVFLPAAVALGILTACGSQDGVDQNLLVAANVASASCDTTKLQQALNFVNSANARQTNDILKRNDGETSLDPLKTALTSKISACGGGSTPAGTTPLEKLAKETCNNDTDLTNEGTVADCKKRGTTAFDYLKGRNLQGDENVRSTPAGFQKELAALPDTPEALSKAVELTGVLVSSEKIAKEGGGSVDNPAAAAQIHGLFRNATQNDVNVGSEGEHRVDWALNTQEERGGASFGTKTMKTKADIQEFLNGTSAESQAARAHVTQAIKAEGYGDDEVARAMSGDGYIPVQIKDASQVLGTTYFVDGKVQVLGKWRQAAGGDVYWLFFAKDGKLVRGALLRADCDNPDAQAIMVLRPGMPHAPPVEQPPGEETCPPGTMPNPETGLCQPPKEECKEPNNCKPTTEVCPPDKPHGKPPVCKDDPARDPAQNGNAPVGGGKNQDPGPGSKETYNPPPTTPYQAPPPPVRTTAPPPPPVKVTQDPKPPTVAPSSQPVNTGVVPTGPGCGNPEFC